MGVRTFALQLIVTGCTTTAAHDSTRSIRFSHFPDSWLSNATTPTLTSSSSSSSSKQDQTTTSFSPHQGPVLGPGHTPLSVSSASSSRSNPLIPRHPVRKGASPSTLFATSNRPRARVLESPTCYASSHDLFDHDLEVNRQTRK